MKTLIALCLICTYAPPEQYQGTPERPVVIDLLPLSVVQKRCGNDFYPVQVIYGCAITDANWNRCSIYAIDKPEFNAAWPFGPAQRFPMEVIEHEIGHCNGWSAHHPR